MTRYSIPAALVAQDHNDARVKLAYFYKRHILHRSSRLLKR